uniref:CRAL-TRIO domain-containing protein n=1 Tax=Chromera velia CCMP2878 TaxID=1169474 RepID=A0A0G4FWJ6_9ALVE|mmetsp:Transcript_46054/g.90762  ORF Transcript_46054/g.90762 Transcript_46054/m.90762 type:complete len:372 (-) Transcript_46054:249-1364(-)|eukprot:Cvel_19135.t1-p1 / transcript=Cvel_19135.t1 / gene=Cvel_19135 / organism=Chromera_velia_CCMP2878 / gene_product=SEC14-like protein 1, putative / transcript_product=SEC14-like protein 1, putative / location=Cvel_scaffold1627:8318-10330(+) / protein_length=371 / sequence_SO=supercontig / SO=protein_coding / is_pseudo=false
MLRQFSALDSQYTRSDSFIRSLVEELDAEIFQSVAKDVQCDNSPAAESGPHPTVPTDRPASSYKSNEAGEADGSASPSARDASPSGASRTSSAPAFSCPIARDPSDLAVVHEKAAFFAAEAKTKAMQWPACVEKMKAKFPDQPDDTIYRFSSARKGNFQKASHMLEQNLLWRQNHLSKVTAQSTMDAMKTGFLFLHKHDKDNVPILFLRGSWVDPKLPKEAYLDCVVFLMERVINVYGAQKVTVAVEVRSFKGAINAPADTGFIKGCASLLSNNYPERLHQLVCFPFPYFAKLIWAAVKLVLDKSTAEKVKLIAGKNQEGAPLPKDVFEFIEERNFPALHGGGDEDLADFPGAETAFGGGGPSTRNLAMGG